MLLKCGPTKHFILIRKDHKTIKLIYKAFTFCTTIFVSFTSCFHCVDNIILNESQHSLPLDVSRERKKQKTLFWNRYVKTCFRIYKSIMEYPFSNSLVNLECVTKYLFQKPKYQKFWIELQNRCYVAHLRIYKHITKWVFHNILDVLEYHNPTPTPQLTTTILPSSVIEGSNSGITWEKEETVALREKRK